MDRPLSQYIPGFRGYSGGGLETVNRWFAERLAELADSPLIRLASRDPAAASTASLISGLVNRLAEEVLGMTGLPSDEEELEKIDVRIARLVTHLSSLAQGSGASSPVILREYLKMVLEGVVRISELVGERRRLLTS